MTLIVLTYLFTYILFTYTHGRNSVASLAVQLLSELSGMNLNDITVLMKSENGI